MRFRTFASMIFALAVVVSVSYFSSQNEDLLSERFALSATRSVPLYGVVIAVFLAGFLPAVSVLLVQSLKRDLEGRRERRLARESKSLRGSFRRALDFREDGQWGKAAAELEALQTEQPENFSALLYYGEALRELGREDEAIEVHRRLSVLYPQGVAVLYQLAKDYEAKGDMEVANQLYDRILRDFPGQGLTILRWRRDEALKAQNWSLAGQLQERVDALLEDGGVRQTASEVQAKRGLVYESAVAELAADRPAPALELLAGLLTEAPDFTPARILQGEALAASGDDAKAVATWSQGFVDTGQPVFLQRIEDFFIEREDPLQAIETLQRIIGQSSNDLLPRFFLGRLYYRLEMHEEALRALSALSGRVRSSPTYHYLLGRIYERRGETKKSVEAYRMALHQAAVRRAEYVCSHCGDRRDDWADRCENCGSWNCLDMDFEEERVSPEALGIRERPVWAVDDGLVGG
jgi:predicted Zn-dependent protease